MPPLREGVRPPPDLLHLTCSGCGEKVNGAEAACFSCPNSASQPEKDHVLMPAAVTGAAEPDDIASNNPFIAYRRLLYSHRVAIARGMSDTEYVAMVEQLDAKLREGPGGVGFCKTPLLWRADLNAFFKVEVGSVAGSHKARHLMNVMLYLLALKKTGESSLSTRRLAVASCGNAGLAAATVAAAASWPIDVCIPPNTSPSVVEKLHALGADVVVCARDVPSVETVAGPVDATGAADPTLAVFRNLVKHHASIPFTVQGPECGLNVEGGHTLAWELVEQLSRDHPEVTELRAAYIQVGGGALGAGLAQGLVRAIEHRELDPLLGSSASSASRGATLSAVPALRCVQPDGNAPLARAYERMQAAQPPTDASQAAQARSSYMWPWPNPASVAHGLLDDETYDWAALCDGMQRMGAGSGPVVVDDVTIVGAHARASKELGVTTCHTGATGFAGLLSDRQAEGDAAGAAPDLVVFTGVDRSVVPEARCEAG